MIPVGADGPRLIVDGRRSYRCGLEADCRTSTSVDIGLVARRVRFRAWNAARTNSRHGRKAVAASEPHPTGFGDLEVSGSGRVRAEPPQRRVATSRLLRQKEVSSRPISSHRPPDVPTHRIRGVRIGSEGQPCPPRVHVAERHVRAAKDQRKACISRKVAGHGPRGGEHAGRRRLRQNPFVLQDPHEIAHHV